MIRFFQTLIIVLLFCSFWLKPVVAAPEVVVSIKPIHSLVASVMEGVGSPTLIVKGSASPHGYSLKPSDAQAIAKAKIVFWVGEELERFLEKSIQSLAKNAETIWMVDAPGITRLEFREGGAIGEHEEGSKGHSAHAGHDHGTIDMHLWLDPENAKAMVRYIAQSLKEADAENAQKYAANAEALIAELGSLDRELTETLSPLKGARFIVFHDSTQYFEKRYGLPASGSVTVNPDIPPGAKRVKELRTKIISLKARCVFSEPQFNPRLVDIVIEGLDAKSAALDPIGSALNAGPELYFTLLRNIAKAMKGCLGS